MSHLKVDRRDWDFLLYEQLKVERLLELEKYADFDRETFDHVISEGIKFAVEQIAPLNEVSDRVGAKLVDGEIKVPAEFHPVWEEMTQSGWLGATHNPEYGGQGLPLSVSSPFIDAMNAGCMAFFMYGGLTHAAGHLIEVFGDQKMKDTYVENMYSGTWGGTMCLTEPQAGSAVGDATTSATPLDDGSYQIEGGKIFISGGDADIYGNVVHLVLARIKGDPEGIKGISLFVVPKYLVNEDGSNGDFNNVNVDSIESKMGINGSATCTLSFGVDGPTKGYLVGEANQGIVYMFQMMNEARIACGVQGSSLANAAYQQALDYAKERRQGPDVSDMRGPSVEIIRHPDVRRNLMFMKAYAEGTRALLTRAAYWSDLAQAASDEGERQKAQDLIDLVTPIAKAYTTDKSFKVTELAIQVFGGYGYCADYPVEQYMRDVKITSVYEGTNGIQALDLLGRKMRQKGGALFMTYLMHVNELADNHSDKEELAPALQALQRGIGALGELAMWLGNAAKDNLALSMLQATPFLELFGDIMVGELLVHQAAIALDALKERYGKTEFSAEERAADSEIAFYTGKIDTARFFVAEVVRFAPSKAKAMMAGETAALDMVWA